MNVVYTVQFIAYCVSFIYLTIEYNKLRADNRKVWKEMYRMKAETKRMLTSVADAHNKLMQVQAAHSQDIAALKNKNVNFVPK